MRGVIERAHDDRPMARPRIPTAKRPECPKGHNGDIWLDGFYSRGEFHERPRFVCVPRLDPHTRKRSSFHPDGSTAHKFIEPLPRRHPNANHPHGGRACVECEHLLDRHEGPQTTRRQVFTIREAARALVAVGEGRSMRQASEAARDTAQRFVTDRWGQRKPSPHGQLSADQLAMFGSVVRDALMAAEWPDAVALDETSFDLTITETDDQGDKVSHPGSVSILGIYGYQAGRGSGRAIRLAARGGADRIEWEAVLRSRTGEPTWVVCDQGKAVMAAVKRAWPNATIYICEAHLRMLGEQRLAADGFDRFHPLWRSLRKAIPKRDAWIVFEQEVRDAGATQTLAWIRNARPLMDHQWAIREDDRPHSIGGLETVFQEVVRRLGDRRFVFRNRARLELVFDLMALDLAKEANDLRYREIIRTHLLRNAGRPTRKRRALDDHGGSSLHHAVREVEARLKRRREQNARAQRAHLDRLRKSGKARTRTPSRRARNVRQSSR